MTYPRKSVKLRGSSENENKGSGDNSGTKATNAGSNKSAICNATTVIIFRTQHSSSLIEM